MRLGFGSTLQSAARRSWELRGDLAALFLFLSTQCVNLGRLCRGIRSCRLGCRGEVDTSEWMSHNITRVRQAIADSLDANRFANSSHASEIDCRRRGNADP